MTIGSSVGAAAGGASSSLGSSLSPGFPSSTCISVLCNFFLIWVRCSSTASSSFAMWSASLLSTPLMMIVRLASSSLSSIDLFSPVAPGSCTAQGCFECCDLLFWMVWESRTASSGGFPWSPMAVAMNAALALTVPWSVSHEKWTGFVSEPLSVELSSSLTDSRLLSDVTLTL